MKKTKATRMFDPSMRKPGELPTDGQYDGGVPDTVPDHQLESQRSMARWKDRQVNKAAMLLSGRHWKQGHRECFTGDNHSTEKLVNDKDPYR